MCSEQPIKHGTGGRHANDGWHTCAEVVKHGEKMREETVSKLQHCAKSTEAPDSSEDARTPASWWVGHKSSQQQLCMLASLQDNMTSTCQELAPVPNTTASSRPNCFEYFNLVIPDHLLVVTFG